MAPYDEKKYSIPLREKFCWTQPQFYSVPILDKSYNEADREFIYNFVSEIRIAMRTQLFPDKYDDTLLKMINICGCLMSLLENQNPVDMQLVLYVLNSLSENINFIKNMELDKDIKMKMKNNNFIHFGNESDLNNICNSFKKIYYDFINISNTSESIEHIIDKHKDLCWNDSHPHSEIFVICSDESEISDVTKWLKEKHILHTAYKIDSSNQSIKLLHKAAADAKVSLDDFWECHVEDDEWMKKNIDKLKTPIFIKTNDVSIYSKPGTPLSELVSIGFDKDILSDRLKC